jgi:hypothetical protein
VPVTLVRLAADGETVARYPAAFAIVRLPEMFSVPPAIPGRPGIKLPPFPIAVAPTVPVPPSVPPEPTVVRLEAAIEPLTSSMPPSTAVAPL